MGSGFVILATKIRLAMTVVVVGWSHELHVNLYIYPIWF